MALFPNALALVPLWFGFVAYNIASSEVTKYRLAIVTLLSVVGFFLTINLIESVKPLCVKAGLFGMDINKQSSDKIPESLGIVQASVFLMAAILFQPFFVTELGEYNAACTSMCLMLFLGFADDVLDLRWRIKIILSFLATLPLLVAYDGVTTILVPKPLHGLLGFETLDLGVFYLAYMSCTAVFTTNGINIYAGINGIETGQSVVIALFVLLHNLIELSHGETSDTMMSIYLMMPFLATCLALFYYNWYPSRVFVGDSFTYFAGMTFAVVGILGHFSKTLMILFIPQLINFVISLPQLLHIVPCPRHRLPRLNKNTGKLECVPSHFTLINLALYICGPLREDELCTRLLIFQCVCCSLALYVRFHLSTYVF
eukprot:TRINITY_DN799_c0_g2_i5.p1 TRINITY_DN799_c0_g2~~TRINITY_DN799_c0_g2_i5.p1  ORF type:complete len:372 (+),score=78.61 TRINITY_DN799_c0_g2_i5:352-1467(+)